MMYYCVMTFSNDKKVLVLDKHFAPFKPDCGIVQICPVFTLYNK